MYERKSLVGASNAGIKPTPSAQRLVFGLNDLLGGNCPGNATCGPDAHRQAGLYPKREAHGRRHVQRPTWSAERYSACLEGVMRHAPEATAGEARRGVSAEAEVAYEPVVGSARNAFRSQRPTIAASAPEPAPVNLKARCSTA
jgi:hypothetical protein